MKTINYISGLITLIMVSVFFVSCEQKIIIDDQFGAIDGTVISQLGDSIPGVLITTNPATSSFLTNGNGKFGLTNLEVGEYTITAKKSTFRTQSTTIIVKEDETTSVIFVMEESASNPIDIEFVPSPMDGATDIKNSTTLTWDITGDRMADELDYDVYLYVSSSSDKELIGNKINDNKIDVSDLNYETTYFWQVIAYEDGAEIDRSDVWSFQIQEFPEHELLFSREIDGSFEIFSSVLDSADKNALQLTKLVTSSEMNPKMSPINDRIAFSSNQTGEHHIYGMNTDGSLMKKITNLPITGNHNNGEGFCWSPDASKILYSHFDDLFIVNRDGTGTRRIAKAPAERNFRLCDWTAQGDKIIVQTVGVKIYDSEFYIMDSDGNNMELLLDNLPGRIESPTFSIQGDKILFTKDDEGFQVSSGRQLDANIYLLDIATGSLTNLSINKIDGTNDLFPRFSPDGASIIFVNTSNTGTKQHDTWIMGDNGEGRRMMIEDAHTPFWYF